MIIDAHAHIIPKIAGQRESFKTEPGKYGKVRIGNYEEQTLPPFLIDSSFNIEMLLHMMNYSGIDKAVLLQNPFFGSINEEVAEAIHTFPDRFIGTIQVDPLSDNAIEIIQNFLTPKQSTLKFELSHGWGWSGIHPGLKIDSPGFIRIWELVSELGLQVIIDPGRIDNPGYQVEIFETIAQRYPGVKILIEHLGYLTSDLAENDSAKKYRLDLIHLARIENVFLGFSATNILLNEDYPCPHSLELLKETVSITGANKILWGSDIPTTLTKYTYSQMVDVVVKHAKFLTEEEKEQIMGRNALNFFSGFEK